MKKIEGIHYANGRKISVEVSDGVIQKIEEKDHLEKEPYPTHFIAPAFFDNQINGYIGIEFSKQDLSVEDMVGVVRALQKKGVVTFLPTVITASQESLIRSFRNLTKSLENEEVAYAIPGFHLEGPYISPVEGYRGAHSQQYVRKPDWDEFQRLNNAAGGKILQVTLAPEVEGAVAFIKMCVRNNIVVSLGHHNGSAEDIERAVDAGARTVTHLGNGMANHIHRFNNPLWMQLADDRLMGSFILDGFHLRPEMAKVFYRAKGAERFILTSDMTMLAGLPPGDYVWDGKNVVLTKEGIIMLPKENCFAGASLPIHVGVGNMIKFTGCSLEEAINMSTMNPARLYGFHDRGILAEGKRADLIVFNVTNDKLDILETVVAGETLDN